MRYDISVCCLAVLVSSFALSGCSRPSEAKSQPPVPIASGEITRAVVEDRVVPADGILKDYTVKARTISEGHVAVYEGGIVIITDPDGTKHGTRVAEFLELSFR